MVLASNLRFAKAMRILISILICLIEGSLVAQCPILDFESAWQRLITYAPSLAAAEAEIAAREAEQIQVSLIPNPIGIVDSENIGISEHEEDEAEPPETTFSISQLIELGGKRTARTALASSLAGIAFWDAQILRRDLRQELTLAFIDVSIAQERVMLARENERLAGMILQSVATKVDCGMACQVEEKKALLGLMKSELTTKRTCTEFECAKQRLSAMWGSPYPDFDGVTYELYHCTLPPCCNCAVNCLFYSPDVERAHAQIISSGKNVHLQKANSVPDINFIVGYTVFHDSDQRGWRVGFELPLPIFDRNQGNIRKAYIEKGQAEMELEDVLRALKERALVFREKMAEAYDESLMIKNALLGEAVETYILIEEGYLSGKYPYSDLLDAQSMVCEIQQHYLDALHAYHISRAELERLIGERHEM